MILFLGTAYVWQLFFYLGAKKCPNKNYLIRIQIWSLSISYIHVKQKILLINETKWDEILLKPEVLDREKPHQIPLTFVKFCDIVCPTFIYFQWPEKRYRLSANIRLFFQVILTIFTLKYFGLLQKLMRNYEILWKSMKVMIFHRIFLVKSFTFVPFCSFAMYFLSISDFKIWLLNFGFAWTILNFCTCLLWRSKKSISQILMESVIFGLCVP